METVWSWKFFNALVINEGERLSVIKEVNYILTGTRGIGVGAAAFEIGGRTALPAPSGDDFKLFENLNQADLIAFVGAVVNIDALKHHIEAQHDDASQIKPLPFEAA